MFFCEYCEIFKNIYFEENLRKAASGDFNNHSSSQVLYKVIKSKFSFEESARFFHLILKTTIT